MRVNTLQTVELSPSEVERIFIEYLNGLVGGAYFKDDGKLYEDDDYGHGSPITDLVKNPSEVRLAAVRLANAINDERRRESKEQEARAKKNK